MMHPRLCFASVAILRVRGKTVLPLAWWFDAWDSHAMCLAVTGQMDFRTAMIHKHWVLEVSSTGGDKAGPFYDELVRCVSLLFAACGSPSDAFSVCIRKDLAEKSRCRAKFGIGEVRDEARVLLFLRCTAYWCSGVPVRSVS